MTQPHFFGAEGGIRTLVCFWHKLISSQPRYDRFDTSAYNFAVYIVQI